MRLLASMHGLQQRPVNLVSLAVTLPELWYKFYDSKLGLFCSTVQLWLDTFPTSSMTDTDFGILIKQLKLVSTRRVQTSANNVRYPKTPPKCQMFIHDHLLTM